MWLRTGTSVCVHDVTKDGQITRNNENNRLKEMVIIDHAINHYQHTNGLRQFDWLPFHRTLKKRHTRLLLKTIGRVYVFEILEARKSYLETNKYEFASDAYLQSCRYNQRITAKYKLRKLVVKMKHYPNKPHYNGSLAQITISEKVWWKIIELSVMLKKHNFKQGNLLAYWRKNHNMIWFAFMTPEQWHAAKYEIHDLKPKNKEQTRMLKSSICWSGHKRDFRLDEFKRYYGTEGDGNETMVH